MPNPEMITLTVGTTTWDIHDGRVGDLSDLATTDKSSIVAAINEAAQSGGGSSVSPYDSNPSAAGTASPGVSALYARGDHVHPAQSVPSPQSSGTPAALGIAARGSATTYSRADHVHETQVFWASYDNRAHQSAAIDAALADGKVVLCRYSNYIYTLVQRGSATYHAFISVQSDGDIYYLRCENDAWSNGRLSVPLPSTSSPSPLGTAAAGSSTYFSRADHVHPMPSAADVGAGDEIVSSASGEIASFSDGSAAPVKDLTIAIDPVQDLHGYDNPWPAGGWKNLIEPYDNNLPFSQGGVTITKDGNGYKVVASGATGYPYVRVGTVHGLKAGTYSFTQGLPAGIGVRLIDRTVSPAKIYNNYNPFTVSEDVSIDLAFELTITGSLIQDGTYSNILIQLESGSTVTAWAPYSNICPITGWAGANVWIEDEYDAAADPTVTVSWQSEAGTVYGGTLDVTSGLLTVDRAMLSDFTDMAANGTSTSGAYRYQINISNCAAYTEKQAISNGLKYATEWNGQANTLYNPSGSIVIFLTASDLASAKTFLTNNGIVVCYPLATPTTVQLTAQQITMLLGNNNVWADTGDSTVRYRADTKLYIDNKIAQAIAAALNS